ncbi:MAG: DNA-binding transcriptional repressor AcrR [Actinomycetia bacterium]|nr:DNA-binding transcriptional repressor AcrR [Actinomycetes bacterium]
MVAREVAVVPTRERIVDAAVRLFSESGTSATSMRDLAEAAGVTVPGLYYHFASKAELIRAVYQVMGLAAAADAQAPVDSETLPRQLEPRIAEQSRRELDGLVEHADFIGLMQREAVLGDVDALEVGRTLREAWDSCWAEVLLGAEDLAPDVDVHAAAVCIATFLWGVFAEYIQRRDSSAYDRIPAFAALVTPALRRTDA